MRKIWLFLMLSAIAGGAQAQGLMKSVGGGSAGSGEGGGGEGGLIGDSEGKHYVYFGFDLQDAHLSVSNPKSLRNLPEGGYSTKFYDARVGYRLFKVVGLEAHYGFAQQDDNNPGRYKVDNYWGLFVVPTANVFNLFELAFPIGYARSNITAPVAGVPTDNHLHSIAYGANLEVPLRVFWSKMPDLRLTGGGMVYYQRSDAREYGFHYGLRYDFGL